MVVVEREIQTKPEAPAQPKHPEFLRAAELIKKHGWWQGEPHIDGREPLCVMLAIGKACHINETVRLKTHKIFQEYMGMSDYMEVVDWNDDPERTEEEVIMALERAAYDV